MLASSRTSGSITFIYLVGILGGGLPIFFTVNTYSHTNTKNVYTNPIKAIISKSPPETNISDGISGPSRSIEDMADTEIVFIKPYPKEKEGNMRIIH